MTISPFQPASPRSVRVEGSAALKEGEALELFGSESEPVQTTPAAPDALPAAARTSRLASAMPLLAVIAVLAAAAGAAGMWAYQRAALARTPASLRIETSVPGVDVIVAGKAAGRTPISLALPAGSYPVLLAGAGARREFTVDLASGASVSRHVELPPAAAAATGSLHVQTEPARLAVLVDGVERGLSPLVMTGLTPGEHQVAVRGEGGLVRRNVTIAPDEKTVLVVSSVEREVAAPAAVGGAGGWVTIASPIALTIREGGKLLGTTEADRLMLPAGEHILDLQNEALGYEGKRTVRIDAGKTATLKVDPPNGVLSINAQPWAEVWLDGQRIGETPIGNLSRSIGRHEVTLRHPDFGERRETVTVTLRQPTRLGVDMRRK